MRVTLLLALLATLLPAAGALPGCSEAMREGISTRTCVLSSSDPCDAGATVAVQREAWNYAGACAVENQDANGRVACAYSEGTRTWTGACARAGSPAASSCVGGSAFLDGSRVVGTAPCA